jgi:hypothetical protein
MPFAAMPAVRRARTSLQPSTDEPQGNGPASIRRLLSGQAAASIRPREPVRSRPLREGCRGAQHSEDRARAVARMQVRTWDEWMALVIGPAGILLCWVGYFVHVARKRRR